MPTHNTNTNQFNRTQLRKECYSGMRKESKYTKPVGEPGLLSRWPKFLRLEVKLPKPTPTEVLANLRLMCPCEPATHEEIAAIMVANGHFKTPAWVGQSDETSIRSRNLSIPEVDVINTVYLELKEELLKQREQQALGRALGEVEANLAGQARAVEERTDSRLAHIEERLVKKIDENHRKTHAKLAAIGVGKVRACS